jgi:hypothetical protein
MKDLVLHPCDMNEEIAKLLEEKNLTSFIKHPDEKLRKELKNDFYKGEDFSATFHSFHSVTINYTDIYLASHPKGYNEVVMIWDSLKEIRPLYFVFSFLLLSTNSAPKTGKFDKTVTVQSCLIVRARETAWINSDSTL